MCRSREVQLLNEHRALISFSHTTVTDHGSYNNTDSISSWIGVHLLVCLCNLFSRRFREASAKGEYFGQTIMNVCLPRLRCRCKHDDNKRYAKTPQYGAGQSQAPYRFPDDPI